LQAQEELLAGVARSASRRAVMDVVIENEPAEEVFSTEDIEVYERSMSPTLFDITTLPLEEREIDIITEKEDRRNLVRFKSCVLLVWLIFFKFQQRRSVAASRFVPKAVQPAAVEIPSEEAASSADLASEALYKAEAEKDLDEEEELFNLEENIVNPISYNWEDKYRPRKPRYFNRVHTGYEWNKYNQTHYEWVLWLWLITISDSS
jgi:Cactus-binding C-terminus of cactin protein